MTTQDNPPVEVTQVDREAAAAYYSKRQGLEIYVSAEIKRGQHDNGLLVQAFAKHRLASQRPAVGDEVEQAFRSGYRSCSGDTGILGGFEEMRWENYKAIAAKLTELQAEVERLKMTAPALSAPPNAS